MKQNGNWSKDLPSLLVQQVRLQWYKDCRGGNAAVQRNQYPRAMRLPKNFFSYYPFGLPIHFSICRARPARVSYRKGLPQADKVEGGQHNAPPAL